MRMLASSRERKSYWVSLVSLIAVVPLAVLTGSRGEFVSWLQRRMERPIIIERGSSGHGAGGSWRLASLRRLPGPLPDTNLMLAEVDFAKKADEAVQATLPCALTLTNGAGRRWAALPLPGSLLRAAAPEVVGKPQCSTLTVGESGGRLSIVEIFLVPQQAEGFALSLALTGAPPLLFK
ncbi:hypothetical protein GHK50_29160 [Sinorhizobium medicae]|uniref:Uncharacterized protein n=1 Tax=Sinorhizobium medicae TaxID=110321 RepID=A0A6G1WTT3_9HYPH|nr:hypothetical protein [Sinorhizobium medicae]MQW73057.1 hypothetical protein [Sinorhizobium medicae]MQX86950.1 hypothetical protein [Sinorhizobium medicae]RVK21408.1 hypothetical protein CN165_08695 [Sinorhizobium medicae]WQO47701.1 hypothetical protein U8C42_25385 [Sinorhizobium medicae]WQO68047.1 hypothetical protein U8C40_26845 [Sinorhizobium medicae]